MTSSPSASPIPIVRWGIVGASDIADRVMAPAMVDSPSAELVAIASRSPDRADWFARRQLRRAARVDTSARALRTHATAADLAADPDIDAVYVATEVDRHHDDVLAVGHHGKDILVEKPIARSADEGRRMVEASAAAGIRLGTCFYQRYNARHLRIRSLLAEGAVGRPTAIQVSFSGRSAARDGAWRQVPGRSGGGPLIDMASHAIDLVRWLCGDVAAVTAMTATLVEPYPVEDTAFTVLRLQSGVLVELATHWSTTDSSDARTSSIAIAGTDGTIASWPLHDKHSEGTLVVDRGSGEERLDVGPSSTHAALLADFAEARAGGLPFPITGQDGVQAQRVVDAAYESARDGRTVRL